MAESFFFLMFNPESAREILRKVRTTSQRGFSNMWGKGLSDPVSLIINPCQTMKTKFVSLYSLLGGAVLLVAGNTSAQNLLVADYTGGAIYQFTPGGVQSTFASGLSDPQGLTFDSAGNLFVANTANNLLGAGSIGEFPLHGTPSTFASGINPHSLAFNSAGNMLAADYNSGNIYEYTPGGVRSTFASGFTDPLAIAFDTSGNLFVGSGYGNNNGIITKIAPNGTQSLFASGLSFPNGLTFDSAGNLYEADSTANRILKFTSGGVESTFASLALPNCMAFDNAGDMYVTTDNSGEIIKIAPGGAQSVFASVGGIPEGIVVVPEPSAIAFFGLAGLALLVRRQTRRV